MGNKYRHWLARSQIRPKNLELLTDLIRNNRQHSSIDHLDYGKKHLQPIVNTILSALRQNKRLALYADYDVDGTMSCVSWIWFLREIGYTNFVHYIPCRFKEGYGLNLKAIKNLVDKRGAEIIITMDTGITANQEAAYCQSKGVDFICTDHHRIQPEKMPDCLILNPKMHPQKNYQELCGCGITFVLLRQLGQHFSISEKLWTDLLALTGMATICDIVPLNAVNHRLAKMGVAALMQSQRSVLSKLRQACAQNSHMDENDVGFRLGPKINAVGRLEHADAVIEAFVGDNPSPLIQHMEDCNEKRKSLQAKVVKEATRQAKNFPDAPILFLGGDWHPGVVGIAASKLVEQFWRPVYLFQRHNGHCKGSARSIPNFDITAAMSSASAMFKSFGGHSAAGGYTFSEDQEPLIREALHHYALTKKTLNPKIWESQCNFDCELPLNLLHLDLCDCLAHLKPFGHGFEEPKFCIEADIAQVQFYLDKQTGQAKHTAVFIQDEIGRRQKIMFFHGVYKDLKETQRAKFIVSATKNFFRGQKSLQLIGTDYELFT